MLKKVFEISCHEQVEFIQPVLNIRVGEKHFSTAITEHGTGRLQSVLYYLDQEGITAEGIRDQIARDIPEPRSLYLVKIGYDYPGNSLVPAAGFQHEDASLLKTIAPAATVTITEQIPAWQLYNVYPVPAEIHNQLTTKFPAAKYWHQVTIGLNHIDTDSPGGSIMTEIRHTDFTVIVAQSGNLLLAQTYEYSSPEDILYYLLNICKRFSLSQNDVHTTVSGLIERESALFKELYQYFADLRFRDADWKTNSKAYPAHFFTSLNDLAQCVS